jgi:hypothetical protein
LLVERKGGEGGRGENLIAAYFCIDERLIKVGETAANVILLMYVHG